MNIWLVSLFTVSFATSSAFAQQSSAGSKGTTASASNKLTVCGVTINSDDEFEEFKKGLGDKAEYIELTTLKEEIVDLDGAEAGKKEEEEEDWFRYACKRKIQCDILVVSGHFAGTFVGSRGVTLRSEDMERNSCETSCDGILQRPKEVYLFGCNTLAGKNPTSRTPEEYRRVLIQEDGFTPERADEVVAFRYSPLGPKFSDQMRRVFRGAKRIYGFSDRAPFGKNVKGMLRNYFAQVKNTDYYTKANFTTLNEEINQPLKEALKVTALVQAAGASHMRRELIPMCYLENPKVPRIEKLNWIETSLKGNDSFAVLPTINEYLKSLDSSSWTAIEKAVLEKIGQNHKLRESVGAIVKVRDSAILSMQLKLLTFMKFFSWVSDLDYMKQVEKLLLGDLNNDFDTERADQICSGVSSLGVALRISPATVPDARWTDVEFLRAFSCMSSFSEAALQKLVGIYRNAPKASPLEKASLEAIRDLKTTQESAQVFYKAVFPDGEQPLDAKTKELLCHRVYYGEGLPKLPIKVLNAKYSNDPKYVENVGCYGKPSSSLISSLLEASKSSALKAAAVASLAHMRVTEKISLPGDSQVQLLSLIEAGSSSEELALIFEKTGEVAPIVRDKALSILNSSSLGFVGADEQTKETIVAKILGKEIYCPNTIARTQAAINSKLNARAVQLWTLFEFECLSPAHEEAERDTKYVGLATENLSKVLRVAAQVKDEELRGIQGYLFNGTVEFAMDKTKNFTSIEEFYGLMKMNDQSHAGRRGNISTDEAIASEANVATLKSQVLKAFDSRDTHKMAVRLLNQLDIEDKGVDEKLTRLVEAESLTGQENSHFPALFRQNVNVATLLWLKKFSKVPDAQLDKVEYLEVIHGARAKFFETLPSELEAKRIDPNLAARAIVVAYEKGYITDEFPRHKRLLKELKSKVSLPVIQKAIIKAAAALRQAEVMCEEEPRSCI